MGRKSADAEETSNRILETFDVDVDTDDQFDVLCDIVEDVRNLDQVPRRLCQHLGKSGLPEDVVVATLLTLLHRHFQKMRARVAPPSAVEPSPETGFLEVSLKNKL